MMKKLLSSILASSLILSLNVSSFATELPQNQTKIETQTLSTLSSTVASAYVGVIEGIISKYGDNPTTGIDQYSGLTFAKLLDFNGDGMEELYVSYIHDGEDSGGLGIVIREDVTSEIWAYTSKGLEKIFTQTSEMFTGGPTQYQDTHFLYPQGNEILFVTYFRGFSDLGHILDDAAFYRYENEAMKVVDSASCEVDYVSNSTYSYKTTWTINGTVTTKTSSESNVDEIYSLKDLLAKAGITSYNTSNMTYLLNGFFYPMSGSYYNGEWSQFGYDYENCLPQLKAMAVATYPAWSKQFIDYVSPEIMPDISTSNYDDPASRGLIAQSLYNLAGNGASATATKDFNDLGNFASAIAWCDANGVMNGMSDEYFGSSETVTREQFALILLRLAQFQGKNTSVNSSSADGFGDSWSISSWAKDGVSWAVSQGLMSGSEGNLNPHGAITRTQVAVMLYNFSQL